MSVTRIATTIPASGRYELISGNFMLLAAVSAAVNITTKRDGFPEEFNSVQGGLYVRRVVPWQAAYIVGAAGTTFEVFIGTEVNEKDETDIRTQIATVSGTVLVSTQPLSTVANTAAVTGATGAETVLFAANLLRKRMRIFVDENNPGTCYLRSASGGNAIANLQPGAQYDWFNTAAAWIRNDTGGNCTFYLLEET